MVVVFLLCVSSLYAQEKNAIYAAFGSAKKVGGDGDQYIWGRSFELGIRFGSTPTTSFSMIIHHSSLLFDKDKLPSLLKEATHNVTTATGNLHVRFLERGVTPFLNLGAGLSIENISGANWIGNSANESKISPSITVGIGLNVPISTDIDLSIMGALTHSRAYESTFIPITIGFSFNY